MTAIARIGGTTSDGNKHFPHTGKTHLQVLTKITGNEQIEMFKKGFAMMKINH